MRQVNIHEAKTHLSQLIAAVVQGETVIISKAGTPVAKLTAVDAPAAPRRIGFLRDAGPIPDDFDRMGTEAIVAAFQGDA